ncbi:MAG: hypothetical protein QN201_13305, partial [Armatimonadota bacterium]|nr:hypothetical protein [Armatimonadota bacterium]
LGIVLLVSAASLFGLVGNLQFIQKVVIVQQYKGAVSLWIPLALLAAARTWPAFPLQARQRSVHAFLVAAAAAVPAFLLRATVAAGVANLVSLAWAILLTIVLLHLWPEVQTRLSAAAVAVAIALGFAVSLSQRVLVDTVTPLLTMLGGLSGIYRLVEWGQLVYTWSGAATWSLADQILYYAVAPALNMLAAVGFVQVRQRMPTPQVGS